MIRLLRERVAELAALDVQRKVFGSSAHRYAFNPPYPEAELAQLEAAHGFTLPSDYRDFIITIGNGGAGPSYGVLPFRGRDAEDYTHYDQLGTAFAYTDKYNPKHILDSEDDDAQSDRFSEYCQAFNSNGALYLCHHGCAARSLLVISGPCRGQVWNDYVADDGGYSPATDKESGVRLTFTSWYMAWLDRAFRELGAP